MNTIRLLPLLLIPLLIGAGATAGENADPQRDLAVALAVRKVKVIRDAERIVVAAVKEVHDSPGIWCGFLVTRQEVTYRIVEVVAGGPAEGVVTVGHLLVSGSGLVAKNAPYLRPSVFHPGARFLLCLHRDGDKWVVQDESFGAVAIDPPKQPDPVRTELLGQVLLLPELLEYIHPEENGRLPVQVVFTEAVPVACDLAVFGRKVEFVPGYLTRGAPHLKFTSITITEQDAEVHFVYDAGGVVGEARFARKDGRLRLTGSKVAER